MLIQTMSFNRERERERAQARVQPASLPAEKNPSPLSLPLSAAPRRRASRRLFGSTRGRTSTGSAASAPLQGKQRLKELLIEVSLFSSRLSRLSRVLLLSSPLLSAGARAGLKRSTPRPSPQPGQQRRAPGSPPSSCRPGQTSPAFTRICRCSVLYCGRTSRRTWRTRVSTGIPSPAIVTL